MISKWKGYKKGDDRYRHIPERVLNSISAQQDASEKLVGWGQMAVVIFFGLLYAVSPKTFSRDMTFEPVPWFVAVFLGATIIRLYLAYRRRLSAPLLYLSVVIDMGLLLGMIWSFHLQYEQPPPFYLKSTTLLYVFIFIALRALRFEARYVIAAGVMAAVGWASMALYAALAPGQTNVITRDYVTYLKSNVVLIGAEFEKHTKSEGVRALCTASTFDIAVRQGYQPAPKIEQRKSRNIEGVTHPIDTIVLAP